MSFGSIKDFGAYLVSKLPQMDDAYTHGRGYDAISELMRAIILRTIEDIRHGGEFRQDAIDYLYAGFEDDSNENEATIDEEYIFSFKAICNTLGMNAEMARDNIIKAALHGERRISTRRRAA